MDATLARARAIAARFPSSSATLKPRPGSPYGAVTFGRAVNLRAPEVSITFARFDAMSDAEVSELLRAAWSGTPQAPVAV